MDPHDDNWNFGIFVLGVIVGYGIFWLIELLSNVQSR